MEELKYEMKKVVYTPVDKLKLLDFIHHRKIYTKKIRVWPAEVQCGARD